MSEITRKRTDTETEFSKQFMGNIETKRQVRMNILVIGVSGSGKTGMMNTLLTNDVLSNPYDCRMQANAITNTCVVTTPFELEFPDRGNFNIQFIDTVGMGDAQNTVDVIMNQIMDLVTDRMNILNKILICVKMDRWRMRQSADFKTMCNFVFNVLKMPKESVYLIITFADFYTDKVIEDNRKVITEDIEGLREIPKSNIITISTPNLLEIEKPYWTMFAKKKVESRGKLRELITRETPDVCVFKNMSTVNRLPFKREKDKYKVVTVTVSKTSSDQESDYFKTIQKALE